jgi:hypothetical protein
LACLGLGSGSRTSLRTSTTCPDAEATTFVPAVLGEHGEGVAAVDGIDLVVDPSMFVESIRG